MKIAKQLLHLFEGALTVIEQQRGRHSFFTFKTGEQSIGVVRGYSLNGGKILLINYVARSPDNSMSNFMLSAYQQLLDKFEIIISDTVLTDKSRKNWESWEKDPKLKDHVKRVEDLEGKQHFIFTRLKNVKFKIDFQLP